MRSIFGLGFVHQQKENRVTMNAEEQIINRVASSNLITFDMEDLWPQGPRMSYDLAQHLWQGLVLRETEFRDALKSLNLSTYQGAHIALHCSADAIVPTWAFMLMASKLTTVAASVHHCLPHELDTFIMYQALSAVNPEDYRDAKVVIKGCSKVAMPTEVYTRAMMLLQPVASSLMFGEPCSTVPLFKKPKAAHSTQ